MSQEAQDMIKKTVIYEMPGTEDVTVRRDVEYAQSEAGALTFDLYAPPGSPPEARLPAVVIVAGYPDAGFVQRLGCDFKEMGSSVSWARLIAASGMAAIAYTNREPEADLQALLRHVRDNAAALAIDPARIGVWASSGNVPLALSLLLRDAAVPLRCALLAYGYLLDLEGTTRVADAAGMFGFVHPCDGKSVADLSPEIPLLLVRAGQDQIPHLNETIERFVAQALPANLPLTLVNHPTGPHAFDLFEDSAAARGVIRQMLAFLRAHLLS